MDAKGMRRGCECEGGCGCEGECEADADANAKADADADAKVMRMADVGHWVVEDAPDDAESSVVNFLKTTDATL